MAICPECHPCLERLVGLAVELATMDPEVRRQASRSARRCLDQEFGPEAIPALIANRLLGIIHQISGNQDPPRPGKPRTAGRPGCPERLAPACDDDLESLLEFAALGNALDFFRGEAEVSREMLARAEFDPGAGVSPGSGRPPGSSSPRTTPGSSSSIALVSGPGAPGVAGGCAVKAGPIQNDLTLADLRPRVS
jgi:uncharacterized protein with ATP-grasp and redox domains